MGEHEQAALSRKADLVVRAGSASEKVEQAEGVRLLKAIGAKVYVLGTKRRKGDYQGTMQTSGLPDVLAFLPSKNGEIYLRTLWWEAKKQGGRLRAAQRDFACWADLANEYHVCGTSADLVDFLTAGGWVKR